MRDGLDEAAGNVSSVLRYRCRGVRKRWVVRAAQTNDEGRK